MKSLTRTPTLTLTLTPTLKPEPKPKPKSTWEVFEHLKSHGVNPTEEEFKHVIRASANASQGDKVMLAPEEMDLS